MNKHSPRFRLAALALVSSALSTPACSGDGSSDLPGQDSSPDDYSASGSATASGGAGLSGVGGATLGSGGTASGGTSDSGGQPSGGSSSGGAASGGAASSEALIVNDRFWKDDSGTPIYSQGGGVLQVGDTYYWYGVKYQGAVTYAANPGGKNSDTTPVSVTAYSSKDLVHWKFENDVVTGESGWFGRLGVAYHKATAKYVLVAQGRGGLYFAKSDTPAGDFTFDNVQTNLPGIVNGTTGDQTIFQDDDGKAYLICSSSNGRANLYVAPLRASDFLAAETGVRIYKGAGREGNALFKYGGNYYFCSSDLHGWNASHSYCLSASNINGPYSAEFVMGGTDADFSHVTQTGFFITVHGSDQDTVIFAGDRWSDFAGNGLGFNQWMPLTFTGTTPHFESLSEWWLDAEKGTWRVGEHNNYALNPSFEADRVATTQPAGWTTATQSGTAAHTNASSGHTARWYWKLSSTTNYQASISQTVASLPNGSYQLSAWVKSSGGQASAQLYAKGFGGSDKTTSLNAAMAGWTKVTVPGIAVTNGHIEIGVTTNASSSQWLNLDDFELVQE